jgi:integrase
LPPRAERRKTYLTAEQLHLLAQECGQISEPHYSLILLLGAGGLRWGEAAALRVRDIDFLKRRVAVTRNAVPVSGRMVLGTPKSGKSRTVGLPKLVVDAISVTAQGKGRDDLLWPGPNGSYQFPARGWLRRAVARCQAADPTFPLVTAHDLRHTAASLAISAGANPKVVQRMLGHASAAMTLDIYADLFDSDMDSVAEKMDRLWAREVT